MQDWVHQELVTSVQAVNPLPTQLHSSSRLKTRLDNSPTAGSPAGAAAVVLRPLMLKQRRRCVVVGAKERVSAV